MIFLSSDEGDDENHFEIHSREYLPEGCRIVGIQTRVEVHLLLEGGISSPKAEPQAKAKITVPPEALEQRDRKVSRNKK